MTLIVNINSAENALPSSDLPRIGKALRELAELQHNGKIVPTGSIQSIDLSYAGEGADQVSTVARNMSISQMERTPAGGWEQTGFLSGKTPAELEAAGIQVKFVFEGENEMFVVVRDESALEHGEFDGNVSNTSGTGNDPIKQSPPMDEAKYQVRTEEVRDKCNELLDLLEGRLDGTAKDAVKAVRDEILDQVVPELDDDSKKAIFIEQLGAYSVRQCS